MGQSQRYLFNIELNDDRLDGWVIDQTLIGRPPWIRISIDGRPFATLIAGDAVDTRALDLRDCVPELAARFEKKPQIPAGFSYRIPTSIPRGAFHTVDVTVVDKADRIPVFHATSTLAEEAIAAMRGIFSDFRFIAIEEIEKQSDGKLCIGAWCSLPDELDRELMFSVNGSPVRTAVRRLPGAPDPQHFTFWPDRPTYALEAVADLTTVQAGARGFRLTGIDASGQRYFPASQDCYLPAYWPECLSSWSLPSLPSIERVTPWVAQRAPRETEAFVRSGFVLTGYSDIWHIDDVMSQAAGRSIRDMGSILDWGCGCGRLTQHLVRLNGGKVHGVDIDADNIAWAGANLPGGTFSAIGLDPPLPFSDGQFDLVVGISVFTHLTEADQFAWLAELRRILKPGGILAVTVAGHNALKKATLPAAIRFYSETLERGFSDRAIGNTFDHILRHRPAYYRNTRHLVHYIEREWSRYFEINAVAPAGMAGQQDLVIATRRSGS